MFVLVCKNACIWNIWTVLNRCCLFLRFLIPEFKTIMKRFFLALDCILVRKDVQSTWLYMTHDGTRLPPWWGKKVRSILIGVAFCAVFEFQKSSHLQPLEWPQVAAFDAWPRYLNLRKSSHLQPLAATRVAASGRSSRVAASGREWPPLPHNVMNSKLRKTPTRSRRQPTYPSQLEKKHLSNKTYFFKMFEDYRQKA